MAALTLAAISIFAQPSRSFAVTDDQAAYDAAVAAGTPAALRDFILEHQDSPLVEEAFNQLNVLCTRDASEDGCNLDDLVLPAAGPTTTSTTTGPTNQGGSNQKASPS